jgi:hypothetical protein
LPSSNVHWQNSVELTARIILDQKTVVNRLYTPVLPQYLANHEIYKGQNIDFALINETTGKLGGTNGEACFGIANFASPSVNYGKSRARRNKRKVTKYLNIANLTQGVLLLYSHSIFAMIIMQGCFVNIRRGGTRAQIGVFLLQ